MNFGSCPLSLKDQFSDNVEVLSSWIQAFVGMTKQGNVNPMEFPKEFISWGMLDNDGDRFLLL